METPFRRHQLQHSIITGGATTAFAAALADKRVKVYAYSITGAGIFEDSDGTDLTGILPTPAQLSIPQPDFLLQTAKGKGLSYTGAGTGYVVWAYEHVMVVNQNF